MSIGRIWYFTDSSAVLGRLTTDSGLLNEFMGAIGSEVSSTVVQSIVLADLGTRTTAKPEDLCTGPSTRKGRNG